MKDDMFKSGPSSTAPMKFHPEKYKGYIQNLEITPEQEKELLQILWNIMSTMVDIGFGEHAVQTVFNSLMKEAIPELEDRSQHKHVVKHQCQNTLEPTKVKEDDYV